MDDLEKQTPEMNENPEPKKPADAPMEPAKEITVDANATATTVTHDKTPTAKANPFVKNPEVVAKKPDNKKSLIVVLLVAAVVLIAVAIGMILWNATHKSVVVTNLETTRSLSSRVKDAPVQQTFAASDPIMVHFDYKKAKVGTVIKYEVVNKDNEVVKSGETTVLRADDQSADSGQRYISIVNTPSTALPAGTYTVKLKVGDGVVKTKTFTVE